MPIQVKPSIFNVPSSSSGNTYVKIRIHFTNIFKYDFVQFFFYYRSSTSFISSCRLKVIHLLFYLNIKINLDNYVFKTTIFPSREIWQTIFKNY